MRTSRVIVLGVILAALTGALSASVALSQAGGRSVQDVQPSALPPGVNPDGTVNLDQFPSLIPVADQNGNLVGNMQKADWVAANSAPSSMSIAVYSLTNPSLIVGYMVPGQGFVPTSGPGP